MSETPGAVENLTCDHRGTKLCGHVSRPAGVGHPCIILFHSAMGIHHQVGEKAKLLTEMGYVAVVADMYGAQSDISRPEEAGKYFMDLTQDQAKLRERVILWRDAAASLPFVDPDRIGAIGYCFGGQCVLELARSGADVKAAVSFHGILRSEAPAQEGAIGGHVMAWCGTEDPYAPPADIASLREEMTTAEAAFQIHEFGKVAHGFTDPDAAIIGQPGVAYNAVADAVSWAGTLALMETVLKPDVT